MKKLLIPLLVLGSILVVVLLVGPGKLVAKARDLLRPGPSAPTTAEAAALQRAGGAPAEAVARVAAPPSSAAVAQAAAPPPKQKGLIPHELTVMASQATQAAAGALFGPIGSQVMGGINQAIGDIGKMFKFW